MAPIIGLVVLIFVISIYASTRTAVKPNAPLGVSLPAEASKDDEVQAVIQQFHRTNLRMMLLFIAAVLPMFLVMAYPSITLLYLFSWIAAYLYAVSRILTGYHEKVLAIKRKNHWQTASASKLINVDTEVSRLKDTMPIARTWFLVPLFISLLPLVLAMGNDASRTMLVSFGVSSLMGTALFYWLYTLVRRERAVAYSENTEVNLACNRIYRRTLSVSWLMVAVIETASLALMSLSVNAGGFGWLFGSVMSLNTIVVLFIILGAYQRIRTEQQKLLAVEKEPYYMDDNDTWSYGMLFYNNPHDSRTMVEKKIGYGYTFNFATKAGKGIAYGTLIGVVLLVGILFTFLFRMDFGKMEMTIQNHKVDIVAPVWVFL